MADTTTGRGPVADRTRRQGAEPPGAERRDGAGGGEADPPGGRVLAWRPRRRAPLPGDAGDRYGAAFANALEAALERKVSLDHRRSTALRRGRELLDQPTGRRELLVGNHPRYGDWWLATLLVDEAESRRTDDPAAALELARLATEMTARLGREEDRHPDPGRPLLEDLAARSWRALGEAQRRGGDLDAAADSLARARRHLRRGTREPLERAALFESSARLLAASGHPRAERCYRAAVRLFDELGEDHRSGRCRLARVMAAPVPDTEAARRLQLAELRRGLALLETDAEPELAAAAGDRLAALGGAVETSPEPPLPGPGVETPPGPACGCPGV